MEFPLSAYAVDQIDSLKEYVLHTPEEAIDVLGTSPPNGYADDETYRQIASTQTVKWANMIFIAARKLEEFAEVSVFDNILTV